MTPDQIRFILETFNLTQRDLAKAMNVSPPTVARWEDGSNAPTGLQAEVLRALHSVALQVRNDEVRRQVIAGLIGLGIGALIAYLLVQRQ
jgi:transcriptional regulator with XRE-family HTH domain